MELTFAQLESIRLQSEIDRHLQRAPTAENWTNRKRDPLPTAQLRAVADEARRMGLIHDPLHVDVTKIPGVGFQQTKKKPTNTAHHPCPYCGGRTSNKNHQCARCLRRRGVVVMLKVKI